MSCLSVVWGLMCGDTLLSKVSVRQTGRSRKLGVSTLAAGIHPGHACMMS